MKHLTEEAREFIGSLAAIASWVITMGCLVIAVDYL